ncbi:MAG: ClbS/DfsB family four-helix bundle protein [Acholeplasmataceae bacterium]|nr:ClbS/DfsB family four-helix bundle protein [Acholeplasmataceae bacterium]
MRRFKTKEELILASEQTFSLLMKLIQEQSIEAQNQQFLFEYRDKNYRDVLVHLHEWHEMLFGYLDVSLNQKKEPIVPKEGYTWKEMNELNVEIWKKYQNTSLDDAKSLIVSSHVKLLYLILSLSDELLFERNQLKWASQTLADFIDHCAAHHYEWAIELVQRQIKLLNTYEKGESQTDSPFFV